MPLMIDQIESGKLVDAVITETKSIETQLSTISKTEEIATLIKQIREMRSVIKNDKFQSSEKVIANEITNNLLNRITIIETAFAQQKTTIDEITERLREKKRAFLPEALVGPQGPLKSTELNDFQQKIRDQKSSALEQAKKASSVKEYTPTNISPLIEQIFNQTTNHLIEAATSKLKEYLSATDLTPENIKTEITRLQEYVSFIGLNIFNTDDKDKHLQNIDAIEVVLSKRIAAFDISFFITPETFSPEFLGKGLMEKTMATGYAKVAAYVKQFNDPDHGIKYAEVKNAVDFLERNRSLMPTLNLDPAAMSAIDQHTQAIELTLANTAGRLLVQNPPQQPLPPTSPYTYAVKLYFLLYGNKLIAQSYKHRRDLTELTKIEEKLNFLDKRIQLLLKNEHPTTLIRPSLIPQNFNPNFEEPAATGLKDDSGQDDLVKQEKFKRNTLRLDHYPKPKEITTFNEMLGYIRNYIDDLNAHWFVKNGRAFITLFLKSGTLDAIDKARSSNDYLAFVATCKQHPTLTIKFPTEANPEEEANAIFSNDEDMTVKKMLLYIEKHYSTARARIIEKMMAILIVEERQEEEKKLKEAASASKAATVVGNDTATTVDSSSSSEVSMEPPPALFTPELKPEDKLTRRSSSARFGTMRKKAATPEEIAAQEEAARETIRRKAETVISQSSSNSQSASVVEGFFPDSASTSDAEEENELDYETYSNGGSDADDLTVNAKGENALDASDNSEEESEADDETASNSSSDSEEANEQQQPQNFGAPISQPAAGAQGVALPPPLATTSDNATNSSSPNNSPRAAI